MQGHTIGVEEEFHVVDVVSGARMPGAPLITARDGQPASHQAADPVASPELHRSVVETATDVHTNLDDLRRDLVARRRALIDTATAHGLRVVAAGALPNSGLGKSPVHPNWRYEWMAEEYQQLVVEQQVCACQVQVGVADRDLAVRVTRRVRQWLPVLLALSVSSPYFMAADTGYDSFRTLVTSRWPTVGPPPDFESAEEYDATVAGLVHSGVVCDRSMIYFDARVSARYPTVEIRIADGCPSVDDAMLIAALSRGLIRTAIVEDSTGLPVPRGHDVLHRAATWRAARSGLDADLVHPVTARPSPAAQVVEALLAHVREALDAEGDWEVAAELANQVFRRGTSARAQRQMARAGAAHADVIASLATVTDPGSVTV
jgi:carboxylate-amine ligase